MRLRKWLVPRRCKPKLWASPSHAREKRPVTTRARRDFHTNEKLVSLQQQYSALKILYQRSQSRKSDTKWTPLYGICTSTQIQRQVGEQLAADETDWKWKHLGYVFAQSGVTKPSRTGHGKDNLEITEQTLSGELCSMESVSDKQFKIMSGKGYSYLRWIQKSSNSVIQF